MRKIIIAVMLAGAFFSAFGATNSYAEKIYVVKLHKSQVIIDKYRTHEFTASLASRNVGWRCYGLNSLLIFIPGTSEQGSITYINIAAGEMV